MPEINAPACPVHGTFPRALHEESFEGAVAVLEQLIATVSGVGTISYTRCPYGYEASWNGLVRALEDLNASISGIQAGGGGVGASGLQLIGNGGTSVNISGSYYVVSSVSGPFVGSGVPNDPWAGSLWYKQDQGRLFVYASGENALGSGGWYQTNAEPIVYKSEVPPSGVGNEAPERDGLLWYNTDVGSLFVYDAVSSGWYEAGGQLRNLAYRETAPSAAVQGELWFDTTETIIKVWNGTEWISGTSATLPVVTTTNVSGVRLDSYPVSASGTRTYTVNVTRGGEVQTSDVTMIHNAQDAYTSQYAVVYSSGILATFSGQLAGSTVELLGFSNTAASTTFRPVRVTP